MHAHPHNHTHTCTHIQRRQWKDIVCGLVCTANLSLLFHFVPCLSIFCSFNYNCISSRLAFQTGLCLRVARARVFKKCGIQLPMPLGLLTVIISAPDACSPYLHCLPQRPRLPFCECWRVHQMFIWVDLSRSTSQIEGEGIQTKDYFRHRKYPNFSLFRISFIAGTGSILGGDAEKSFMINLLMGALMLQDFPCQRWCTLSVLFKIITCSARFQITFQKS